MEKVKVWSRCGEIAGVKEEEVSPKLTNPNNQFEPRGPGSV